MVSATTEGGRTRTWVLRPNQSLTWRQAKLFFGVALAVSLGVAISFASLGFWPVLPFAGAELTLLGAALYYCQCRGQYVEVISLQGNRIAVEKGRCTPEERWVFELAWVQVRLQPARFSGHPSRLVLRSHGRQVTVGAFLVEEERRRVARELRVALAAADVRTSAPD